MDDLVSWIAAYAPHHSVFLPVYASLPTPTALNSGTLCEYRIELSNSFCDEFPLLDLFAPSLPRTHAAQISTTPQTSWTTTRSGGRTVPQVTFSVASTVPLSALFVASN